MATALVALVVASGCGRHVATTEDCRAVLDRLVDLELKESGYRDSALAPRWQSELARRFESDLRRCRSLRVRDSLGGCLAAAQNPEEVTHRCLD